MMGMRGCVRGWIQKRAAELLGNCQGFCLWRNTARVMFLRTDAVKTSGIVPAD
ncbi:hypothetical protein SAMN04488512_12736 [Sulfitobacter litoralis]|uniref:Uncharacterized protein n=1 Tax=Sulfitobacter litoralis TaxID=335975 RepID=A0ABY0T0Z1_9RHOB|nr:hypothetical protein SAMN04488512_12736 [Sulfitobacter litoralis]